MHLPPVHLAPMHLEGGLPERFLPQLQSGVDVVEVVSMGQRIGILNRSPSILGRWCLVALLVPYVFWLIFSYRYNFLDCVNLPLHEAGHLLFMPFGRTVYFLGGTLGQLLFPALFIAYFLKRGERFEASILGIWLSESLMYTDPADTDVLGHDAARDP